MKLRGMLALALMLGCAPALAQVTPGTSPLSGAKGGTNNAFMQFTGPASSMKTYALPNATGTIAMLNQIQTWTAGQVFNVNNLVLNGSSSGASIINAPATGGGTTTLFPGTDTIAGLAAAQTFTNKTIAGGALSGTFTGTPTFSGANFLALSNLAQSTGGGQFLGVAGAAVANYAPITLSALPNLASPSGTLDLIPIINHTTGAMNNVTPNALGAAGAVSSFNALTGAVAFRPIGAQNATIVESHAANAVTFALKTLAGVDPSAADPVFVTFPDGSKLTVAAALSVTIPSTGTIGTTSAIPFRLWFALINDAGTIRLGVQNCSTSTFIKGFPSTGLLSTTNNAGLAGVTYTGIISASKSFVILGYATYESGMATAGTWITSPSTPVLFVPGIPRPGDATGNSVVVSIATPSSNATLGYVDTALTATITPQSAANMVNVYWDGVAQLTLANIKAYIALRRGGSILGAGPKSMQSGGANLIVEYSGSWTDAPGSAGSLTYVISTILTSTAGSPSIIFGNTDVGATMILTEVMG